MLLSSILILIIPILRLGLPSSWLSAGDGWCRGWLMWFWTSRWWTRFRLSCSFSLFMTVTMFFIFGSCVKQSSVPLDKLPVLLDIFMWGTHSFLLFRIFFQLTYQTLQNHLDCCRLRERRVVYTVLYRRNCHVCDCMFKLCVHFLNWTAEGRKM